MPDNPIEFRPTTSLSALKQRAELLQKLRAFLIERGFIEVETPLLSSEIIPELHIEPIRTEAGQFLQASPELHMKRLLAAGMTAIFQVTRSFRADECGQLHNPEFTIAEWYRVGDDMTAGMDLLDELMQSLLHTQSALRTTYAEAFQRYVGICPHTSSLEQLAAACGECSSAVLPTSNRDDWLNLLLATRVEPQLGRDRPEIIYYYPASQASLAKVVKSGLGYDAAERFEMYYYGVELANGFHELADDSELRRRLTEVNTARVADGRPALPLPETLLSSMASGLPAATGVALGFDRLAMLAVGAKSLAEVMTFSANCSTMG